MHSPQKYLIITRDPLNYRGVTPCVAPSQHGCKEQKSLKHAKNQEAKSILSQTPLDWGPQRPCDLVQILTHITLRAPNCLANCPRNHSFAIGSTLQSWRVIIHATRPYPSKCCYMWVSSWSFDTDCWTNIVARRQNGPIISSYLSS